MRHFLRCGSDEGRAGIRLHDAAELRDGIDGELRGAGEVKQRPQLVDLKLRGKRAFGVAAHGLLVHLGAELGVHIADAGDEGGGMSFAYDVKAELCKVPINRSCCAVAEGCGVLLYASAFTANEVRIVTENDEFAARLPKLFQKAFSLRFDELPDKSKDGGKLVFRITQEDKLDTIWRALGYDRRAHFALHLNFALLEEECCRASFLRGAFLSGGSVTDPQKRYHLELATSHVQAGREVEALLRDMGFEPKNDMRQNNLITYFKSSTHIEDLLTLIGAPGRALEIMSAKIEKEMRNTVNRRVNCDAANLDKAVLASREQVEAFTRLTESGAINDLPVKLQEVAVARLLQPELTLSELAATFDPPLTKSCLNHRIRKLMEIAKKEENE